MKGMVGLFAAILAVGALWYYGQTQPTEVVERKVRQEGSCPTCSGVKWTL